MFVSSFNFYYCLFNKIRVHFSYYQQFNFTMDGTTITIRLYLMTSTIMKGNLRGLFSMLPKFSSTRKYFHPLILGCQYFGDTWHLYSCLCFKNSGCPQVVESIQEEIPLLNEAGSILQPYSETNNLKIVQSQAAP